ncbi:MAG: condensation domain-containing protein, partial [Pyrinomonadaceae bacterium]
MIADIYELSPMQRSMLFHAAYSPRSTAHFNQFGCKLSGPLEPGLFRRAWEKLVERHGVLRTSFHWEGLDKPVQVVHDAATLPWTFEDWRHLDARTQDARWREHLRADLEAGFALDRPPLMRCTLVRTAESEYLFKWSFHHIIMDGWCLSPTLEELFKTYDALASLRTPDLPPPSSYRTYIEWLQRQDVGKARDYWADYLKGFRAATELPTLREKTPGRPEAGGVAQCELPDELGRSLRLMAHRHGVTPSVIIQGAWALLLSRYSGERDVVFGTTVSGRPAELPGVGDMLGLFINTVPVRVRVEYEAVLMDWLKQIQVHQADRSRYEYEPLSDVQQWSEVPRGTPLFNSNVIFMNYPLNESLTRGGGGLIISEPHIYDRTDIPLQLQVTPGREWTMEVAYNEAQMDEPAALRLLEHLRTLLASFCADPSLPLRRLALLSPDEGRALLASTLP